MKIFISYSTKDYEDVRIPANALQYHNHEVFFAGDTLNAGMTWFEKISTSIQDTDIIIAFVTKEFVSIQCPRSDAMFAFRKRSHGRRSAARWRTDAPSSGKECKRSG